MSRKKARKIAMQIVYSQIFNIPYTNDSLIAPYENVYNKVTENEIIEDEEFIKDKKYIDFVVNGIKENVEQIDDIISRYLNAWTIDKISKVDLAILRLSTFEMMTFKDLPISISISEAVNLAREYSEPKSVSFINGILASISKSPEITR